MAKLPDEVTETINRLKQQALEIVESATAAEFILFDRFGETEETLLFLEELKTVSEDASASFSRFNTLQLRIAEAQPMATSDMIEMLMQTIARTQNRIPAWERSIQEV
ncbi:MAG: hypothetical protein AB4290_28345, partial [Spirulina sp.]